ncbi:hypothetical protein V6N12_049169 [Hibiscus sabdariffa]|uniref:RNase H type-1 domain-containing protein n=1 Tax=Hibiscus sabdariffa TaxID=183260 RepID=A0ABR2EJE7_9ROSI
MIGSYGNAGIGGLLRDERARICMQFSKSIGVTDPTSAELRSILEACALYSSSRWRRSHSLIIETDSLLATKWIQCPANSPHCFWDFVNKIISKGSVFEWKIAFVYREGNEAAHRLANQGIGRTTDLLCFNCL